MKKELLISALIAFCGITYAADSESNNEVLEKEQAELTARYDSLKAELEEIEGKEYEPVSHVTVKRSRREIREEEKQSATPYKEMRKTKVTYGFRASYIGPNSDSTGQFVYNHGVGLIHNITPNLGLGVKDFSVNIYDTYKGNRCAISVAPEMEFTFTPQKWFQIGFDLGASIQTRFGSDEDTKVAIAPFLGLVNQYFFAPKFSIGPEVHINIAANDSYQMHSFTNSASIPEKGVWLDGGIRFSYHF